MDESPGRRRRSLMVDLTPLRQSPAFARLWAGSALAGIGAQVTVVAVGLHLYHLTESTLAVSLVALWSLIPMIAAGLWGGMLADAFDRRRVALLAATGSWLSIAVLTLITLLGNEATWPLYLLTAINAASATILGTTRAAILPRLLPPALLPAAAALSGISMGLMVTVGPAVAGVLVAVVGYGWTYLVDVVLFSAAFLGVATLPRIVPEGTAARPGLKSLAEGMRFLRSAPNVRATFVVDIIAMTFGTPRAVFPAVGALVIGGGPVTVGVLTAAYAIGALVCSLL
ncbi:MFS transporter, partial [Leucobacter sp. M11]|uniref:MFS transporter n=1 Tax=Leucobacter sp. M11 TaxID=2993565 RepID=UPI002D7F18BA